MEIHENKPSVELAVLIGLDTGEFDVQASLDELEELAKSAGAEIFCRLIQKKDKPDIATFVGAGMLREIKDICEKNSIGLLIFDNELSPSQIRTVEKETDVRVVDRTTLILDIFAARARSGEGKLQVELAQLQYSLTRLTGKGVELSRLGAGIGTRGPGESKLETDRRHARRRIQTLKEDLKRLQKHRDIRRKRRQKNGAVVVAIVGYTNTGKSTLLNTLTAAGVLAQDKLFATLDPTARRLNLPDGRNIMLVDTVGFVSRLPHTLVEAFKSTLEEAVYADLILNICDASNPDCEEQISITKEILSELGAGNKPIIDVYNKCDIAPESFLLPQDKASVKISALNGDGVDVLLACIAENLPQTQKRLKLFFPFANGAAAAAVRKDGTVLSQEYLDDGLLMEAVVDIAKISSFKEFII